MKVYIEHNDLVHDSPLEVECEWVQYSHGWRANVDEIVIHRATGLEDYLVKNVVYMECK